MLKRSITVGLVAGLAGAALIAGAGPAGANTSPANCQLRNDFYSVQHSTGTSCYANQGDLAVPLSGSTYISSGNNVGNADFNYPGAYGVTYTPKFKTVNYFNNPGHAVNIYHIFLSPS